MTGPIGFIGLGAMGGPMAQRLVAAGHPLVVCDASAGAAGWFASHGHAVAESPRVPRITTCRPRARISLPLSRAPWPNTLRRTSPAKARTSASARSRYAGLPVR